MAGFNDEVYRLHSLDEILGNDEALSRLRAFARAVNGGARPKPILIHGPPGTGKSAAVALLARENQWEVLELNASNNRDEKSIRALLASSQIPRNLFGKRKIILFDEIEELTAKFDKGASSAINALIGGSQTPIIFIANNMWDKRIAFLRGKADDIRFKKVDQQTIRKVLERTARRTGGTTDPKMMDSIAVRSRGDVRGSLNDMCVMDGAAPECLEVLGWRDRKTEIFDVLDKIFMSNTVVPPLIAIANSDVSIDMLMSWVEENIPNRYTHARDLGRAFDSLALASKFYSRAARAQYYTYWRYANFFTSSGIALAKSVYPSTRARYAFPMKIKALGASKSERLSLKGIAQKMQYRIHSSAKKIAKNEIFIIMRGIAKAQAEGVDDKAIREFLESSFSMEKAECDYLMERAALAKG